MIPQQTRLEVLANNIANANTVGFKRESAFERSLIEARENLNSVRGDAETEDTPTYSYTDFSSGALEHTDNGFDLALGKNDQYFLLTDNDGKEYYTRAGHFTLLANGTLGSPDGKTLMGDSGPITLLSSEYGEQLPNDEKAVTLRVETNGEVFANERPVGKLQVFSIDNPQSLQRHSGSQFAASDETNITPTISQDIVVKQGYIENSNVNIISEMVEMIQLQRLFEAGQKVISTNDGTLDRSIDMSRFA